MRESCLYGSARGVLGNRHSYRNYVKKVLAQYGFQGVDRFLMLSAYVGGLCQWIRLSRWAILVP